MLTIAFFLATGRHLHYRRGVPLDGWTAYAVAVLNVLAVPLIHQATISSKSWSPEASRPTASYSDATSVVGLAYLGWLSAISVSLSRALVVGAHSSPTKGCW